MRNDFFPRFGMGPHYGETLTEQRARYRRAIRWLYLAIAVGTVADIALAIVLL